MKENNHKFNLLEKDIRTHIMGVFIHKVGQSFILEADKESRREETKLSL